MIESRAQRYSVFSIFVILCFWAVSACGQAAGPAPSVTPQVDERVELLSIVWRLAGSPEYNMDTLPSYSQDIDRYFAPYRNYPAVQMARTLERTRGVSYDAVMAMAVSLSPPPGLHPLVPFSDSVPEPRWGMQGSDEFLPLLRDFYRDSKFEDFYREHSAFYQLAESRFAATLGEVDFGWYPQFYGEAPNLTYHLILGMNNGGGNYGPRLIHPDGRMELFSIVGCWTHDGKDNPTYPENQRFLTAIIHEFNHSFVNPAVDTQWRDFTGADAVYGAVAEALRQIAYGDARTMVNESLVRAAVIIYFKEHGEDAGANLRRVRREQALGFFWMDSLVDLLQKYEAQRDKYPTFTSFLPRVVEFYQRLAPRATQEYALYQSHGAHVANMKPFTNHEQDVDPAVSVITIVLDKPLDPKAGYSIGAAAGSGATSPIAGTPTFAAGGLQVELPVHLEPRRRYAFLLTPLAFATPDGYPLALYEVDFATK
ncbi:MAG: DUF4932 domain-containing protein [Acidobacteriaceae bacterium]